MLKRSSMKSVICLMLTLALLFTFSSSTVLAATTQNISINTEQSFTLQESQMEMTLYYYTMYHSQWNYDDGTYRGALPLTSVTLLSQTPYGNNMYTYVYQFSYYGTVTKYPLTKTMSINSEQSFTLQESQMEMTLYYYTMYHSQWNYDDGSYRGALPLSNVTLLSKTDAGNGYYNYSYQFSYYGTVNAY